jgi:transcriptional regulator with XRE-family HTH domain
MSTIVDDISARIGRRIGRERELRGWSLTDLAERSGVSRAMIHKVERGESSPTASLLGKLSGAFGLTISSLIARGETRGTRVLARSDQELWVDPDTGYVRRQVISIPAGDLTEVVMPPGKEVAVPSEAYDFGVHVVWVIEGRLTFVAGDETHVLAAGDRLRMGDPVPVVYRNVTDQDVRYLVTVFGSSLQS